MLFLILIVLVLTLFYYKLNKLYAYWEVRGVKHLKPKLFFGNVANSTLWKESFVSEMTSFYNAFPNERYIGIYFHTTPILIVRDPDLIKSIFVKDFDHFVDHRPFVPEDSDSLWSKNLFTLRGTEWKEMRSTLSPAFTSSKMRNMFVLISETVDVHMKHLSNSKISKIEIADTFSRYTNDVIASVAFGIKCDSINNKNNEFYAMAKRITTVGIRELIILSAFSIFPTLIKWIGIEITPNEVKTFFKNVITKTIQTREEKGIFRPDMISLLLEEKKQGQKNGEHLTNDDIMAQAFIFLFAGFDTVSNLLMFCTYQLSRSAEVQVKLQNEIDGTVLEDGKLTYEALMKLKYMDQVISEVLRLWLPALAGDRICTKAYTIEPQNPSERRLELKPGDQVWAVASGLQTDDKYFPNPNVFDPDRFNSENKGNINPYTYMPFGIGPRICIGMRLALMETKALLFSLLSKYTLVATSSQPAKLSKISFDLRFDGEVWIELKPRHE